MANGTLAAPAAPAAQLVIVNISKKGESPTTGLRCHSRVHYHQHNNFSDL